MEDFRIYDTIDSTNKECQRLLLLGHNLHGTTILALHQTEGLGQYGRSWISEPGNHLAMSIILQPEKMTTNGLPLLSLKTSIAVIRVLHQLFPDLPLKIKWPNDIYAGELKLAGILIENSLSASKVQHSIIGIGMNVNENDFPPDLPNPVSLHMLTGEKSDVISIAKTLKNEVLQVVDEPFEKWKPEYDQLIYGLGEENSFELKGKSVIAKITGVDKDGKIRLDIDGQVSKSYFSHEIKWLK